MRFPGTTILSGVTLLLFGIVALSGCSEEGEDLEATGSDGAVRSEQPLPEGTDAKVDAALEEILEEGSGYIALLSSIKSAGDAQASWSELKEYARRMSALGEKYAVVQDEVTLRMDTSAEFAEFNRRLQQEMTRLNADPDISQMFLALGQADSAADRTPPSGSE